MKIEQYWSVDQLAPNSLAAVEYRNIREGVDEPALYADDDDGQKFRTVWGQVVQLRAENLADTQTDFEQIVIRQTAAGGQVRVMDVATVIDGFEQNEILATANGKPAVLLQVKTTDDMQVVKASDAVTGWIERTQPTLPVGVELTLWSDMTDFI